MENTVTTERIEKLIENVECFNNGKTTVCIITLKNGFEVVGTSACVDRNNFNEEIGVKYAYKQAYDKIEELEGYRLQSELYKLKIKNSEV